MTTVRPSGLSGLFPAGSGSYGATIAGYTGIELTNYRTVSMWVKIPTVSGVPTESTTGALVQWGHSFPGGNTHGRVWSCELKNGKPRLWVRGAHATVDRQLEGDRAVVDDGDWHLLVFQFQQGVAIEDVELYIDDTGPLDMTIFGQGTTINTTGAGDSQPVTIGARQIDIGPDYFVEREMRMDQLAIWTQPLLPENISFLYNKGKGSDGLPVTGTDGRSPASHSPNALSGTIDLDAWYTWDDNGRYVGEVWDNTANPSRRFGQFEGANWIHDTPSSGIFPQ